MAAQAPTASLLEACSELVCEVDMDRLVGQLYDNGQEGWALAMARFSHELKRHAPWPDCGGPLHALRRRRGHSGLN